MKRRADLWLLFFAAVCAVCGWQAYCVWRPALKSGDLWLLPCYAALAGFLLVFLLLLLVRRDRLFARLEQLYPAAGFLLGSAFLFVLAPLSAPDEAAHYISAYRLSSGLLGEPAADRRGRVLVRPEDAWIEDLDGIVSYTLDEDGIWQPTGSWTEKRMLGATLDESAYRLVWETGISGQGAPERTASFLGEPVRSTQTPVTTTPLVYLPQALGIAAARLLGLKTLPLLYLGRFFNLFCFVLLVTLALRRLPFGKEVLFGTALLPMTLHLSASFSYDAVLMGCLFLFTAVCLDLAYEKERVCAGDVLLLAALMGAAGPCKMVYTVFMGLCLLIPVKKFGGTIRWVLSAAAVLLVCASAMLLVNRPLLVSYVSAVESVVPWSGGAGYSLKYLYHYPAVLWELFYNTVCAQAGTWLVTMAGVKLGALDPVLSVPQPLIMAFIVCLVLLSLRKPGEPLILTGGRRLWVLLVCAGCAAALMLSMLIAWTPFEALEIAGVQGRYFLPFLPLMLMALKNDAVVLTKDINRSIVYIMCAMDACALLRLFSIVCMRL